MFVVFVDHCSAETPWPRRPEIIVSADSEIFPETWLKPEIDARANPLNEAERERSIRIVEHALAKYPPAFLDRNLQAVVVVGSLQFSGISASGTNSLNRIYIANSGSHFGFSDQWFERVLHSEFSSIVLRNYRGEFPRQMWVTANSASFRYGTNGVDAVRKGLVGRIFDEHFLSQGFIGRYAQSSLENDFNSIAGQLLLGEPKLWEAADRHEGIGRKLHLSIEFYSSIEPSMNADYFRSLSPFQPEVASQP